MYQQQNPQSQYAQGNNYQASSLQSGGVNQFGAQYSSGHRDENIGQAYYQSQAAYPNNSLTNNQYPGQTTGNNLSNSQYQGMNSNSSQQGQYGQGGLSGQYSLSNLGQLSSGASQYAQGNNYYQSSMARGRGVNQYGAQYSSGNLDSAVGESYYQAIQPNNYQISANVSRSQYQGKSGQNQYKQTGYTMQTLPNVNQYSQLNQPEAAQSTQNNNYYQSSMASNRGGVNQYGAQYSSGNLDSNISNAYYHQQQNQMKQY